MSETTNRQVSDEVVEYRGARFENGLRLPLASPEDAGEGIRTHQPLPCAVSVLTTPRLMLRKLKPGDDAFILELLNEADFLRFIGDKGVKNLADAREYIRTGPVESYLRNGFGLYLACLRDGWPLGICGLVKRRGLDHPDLGFAFLARYRGRGYALEAARAVLEGARREFRLPRIVAITSPDNERSIALLQKTGFEFERLIRLRESSEELKLFGSNAGVPQ